VTANPRPEIPTDGCFHDRCVRKTPIGWRGEGYAYDAGVSGVLGKYVDAFVDGVAAELEALAGADHRADVTIDAGDLAAAVFDSDGRLSGDELRAWVDDIGPRLDPPVIITPDRLRDGGMLQGKRSWLDRPSTLFDLLVKADGRDGGHRATRYYEGAMRLAHASAAVDLVPSPDEIAAIDRYRSVLLGAFDAAGVVRPGAPRGAATPAAASPPSTTAPVPIAPAEPPPARPIEDLLAELDDLVGLDSVKADVRRLTSLLRIQQLRAERQLPTLETSHHLVFTGNPGTGKTTVARLLSQILRTLGLVSKGHLVETDRSHLVAGYVGQTAAKTRAVLESALGGTLLIDEAYALARGGDHDFGREAIDTVVKYMEDHRDDLSLIAAGYPAEIEEFIGANPGLRSRFTRFIDFPDYTADELVEIFERMSGDLRYHLDDAGRHALRIVIEAEPRTRGFGNARFVRNLFEEAVGRQAERLAAVSEPTDDQLTTLTAVDVAGT
jgi:AAA lid domain/ATPase family associated with various cellular activities (AAA)